jgi:hypothetical protein
VSVITNLSKSASAVVIEIDINDLRERNSDDVIATYRQILSVVPTGPKIVLAGILPIDEDRLEPAIKGVLTTPKYGA